MTTDTVAFAPRPAVEIDPPMLYSLPARQYMSKTERREKAIKGESTLPPKRPPYTPPPVNREPRIWDAAQRKMVPLSDFHRQVGFTEPEPVPTEYHFTTGAGGCKIFTPCSKRPCYEDDHTDVSGKVLRWKGTTRDVIDIPLPTAPQAGADAAPTTPDGSSPSPASRTTSAPTPSISTATAPRLGPATDVLPRFQIGTDGTCSTLPVHGTPRLYLRGTKRWLGQVLPSFRPPM